MGDIDWAEMQRESEARMAAAEAIGAVMYAQFVEQIGDHMLSIWFDCEEDLVVYMEHRGFRHVGREEAEHLLADLRGKPRFDGIHGPASNYGKSVRYDTWQVVERLST